MTRLNDAIADYFAAYFADGAGLPEGSPDAFGHGQPAKPPTSLTEGDHHTISASHLPGLFAVQLRGDALAPMFHDGELLLVSREREPKEGDAVVIARPAFGVDVSPVAWACGFLRGADLHDSHGVSMTGFVARGFVVQGVVVSVAPSPTSQCESGSRTKPRRIP